MKTLICNTHTRSTADGWVVGQPIYAVDTFNNQRWYGGAGGFI